MEPKDEAGGASFLKQQLWVRKTMALRVTRGVSLGGAPLGLPSFSRDMGGHGHFAEHPLCRDAGAALRKNRVLGQHLWGSRVGLRSRASC